MFVTKQKQTCSLMEYVQVRVIRRLGSSRQIKDLGAQPSPLGSARQIKDLSFQRSPSGSAQQIREWGTQREFPEHKAIFLTCETNARAGNLLLRLGRANQGLLEFQMGLSTNPADAAVWEMIGLLFEQVHPR